MNTSGTFDGGYTTLVNANLNYSKTDNTDELDDGPMFLSSNNVNTSEWLQNASVFLWNNTTNTTSDPYLHHCQWFVHFIYLSIIKVVVVLGGFGNTCMAYHARFHHVPQTANVIFLLVAVTDTMFLLTAGVYYIHNALVYTHQASLDAVYAHGQVWCWPLLNICHLQSTYLCLLLILTCHRRLEADGSSFTHDTLQSQSSTSFPTTSAFWLRVAGLSCAVVLLNAPTFFEFTVASEQVSLLGINETAGKIITYPVSTVLRRSPLYTWLYSTLLSSVFRFFGPCLICILCVISATTSTGGGHFINNNEISSGDCGSNTSRDPLRSVRRLTVLLSGYVVVFTLPLACLHLLDSTVPETRFSCGAGLFYFDHVCTAVAFINMSAKVLVYGLYVKTKQHQSRIGGSCAFIR